MGILRPISGAMGFTDIHCHIVPGVDDGAKDAATAAAMLKQSAAEGVTAIIVTPHFRADRNFCTPESFEAGFSQLQAIAALAAPELKLYPGAEARYHAGIAEDLRSGAIPTLAGSRYVLLEFGIGDPVSWIIQGVEELLSNGYTPVIAHVERCRSLRKQPGAVLELVEMGAELQMNADDILFRCGFRTALFCRSLLRKGLVSYVGTDAHSDTWRKPEWKSCAAYLTRRFGKETAAALLGGNCGRIIGGNNNG